MTAKKAIKLDFETSIKELELIISTIEQGGLNLEASLELFSKGVVLTKECQQALKMAEQKVKILTEKNLIEFNPENNQENNEE